MESSYGLLLKLIDYALWIGEALGAGSLLFGIMLGVLGKENYSRYIVFGLSSILVASFGWGVIEAIYGAPSSSSSYLWIFYVLAGIMLASSSIYIAIGRREGYWSLIASILFIGLGYFSFSLAGGNIGGAIAVEVYPSSTSLTAPDQLTFNLTIRWSGGSPPYTVSVDWGDGTFSTGVANSNEILFSHSYPALNSTEMSRAYTVTANVSDNKEKGFNEFTIMIQNSEYCPFDWPFSLLCPLYKFASIIFPVLDLGKLAAAPIMPESGELHDLYEYILKASMGFLGLFLSFDIAARAFREDNFFSALIDSIKDASAAVALAFLAPSVYNATASMLNTISLHFVSSIDIGWVFSWIAGQLALSVILGYAIPFAANYGSMLAFLLTVSSTVIYARYVLLLTIVSSSPLLSIAYLHPALRASVKHILGIFAGLLLAGPLTSIFLVVLNSLLPAKEVTFAILYPIIVGIVPSLLGAFGGGMASFVGEKIASVGGSLYRGSIKAISSANSKVLRERYSSEPPGSGITRLMLHGEKERRAKKNDASDWNALNRKSDSFLLSPMMLKRKENSETERIASMKQKVGFPREQEELNEAGNEQDMSNEMEHLLKEASGMSWKELRNSAIEDKEGVLKRGKEALRNSIKLMAEEFEQGDSVERHKRKRPSASWDFLL
ncbi:MAG: hypothetical protein QW765_05290 [Fervidicoccaceae archaeon]